MSFKLKQKRPVPSIRRHGSQDWQQLTLTRQRGRTTISDRGLNERVRDGKRVFPLVYDHQNDVQGLPKNLMVQLLPRQSAINGKIQFNVKVSERRPEKRQYLIDQMFRIISIGQLNALLHLHIRPIDLVVFQVPSWPEGQRRSYLGNSLALRCFQRLSSPCLATRRCR